MSVCFIEVGTWKRGTGRVVAGNSSESSLHNHFVSELWAFSASSISSEPSATAAADVVAVAALWSFVSSLGLERVTQRQCVQSGCGRQLGSP